MKKINGLFQRAGRYLTDQHYRFLVNASRFHMYDGMSDEEFIRRTFRATMGAELNLSNPTTYNEKLQWLKLYDHNPEYTVMVDKCRAKEWVAARIGEEYVLPTLGEWEDPADIDFDTLPDQFVLKCNHNSGFGMYICRDKSKMNVDAVRQGLKKGLAQDYYLTTREWPYKDVPRRILAEPFLDEGGDHGLTDYKVHVFGGEVKCILVCKDRFSSTGVTMDYYTPDWQKMPVHRPRIPGERIPTPRPALLEDMLTLATVLAKDLPFLRVDFYFVAGRIYFSELTFSPVAGFQSFNPPEWDNVFGAWLELPRTDI